MQSSKRQETEGATASAFRKQSERPPQDSFHYTDSAHNTLCAHISIYILYIYIAYEYVSFYLFINVYIIYV